MLNKRLFTLLELVIAFAILSLIATLTGSLLFTTQQSWGKLKENTAQLETNIKLDRIANQLFRNAVPFHWPDEDKKNRQIFRGRPDFIRLAYLHRMNGDRESGLRFVELFLRNGALLARYRQYPIITESAEGLKEEILACGVKSLAFRYAMRSKDGVVWVEEFDEMEAENIPMAIQMTIEFENDENVCYLRRTAGNSRTSSYGKYDEKKQ